MGRASTLIRTSLYPCMSGCMELYGAVYPGCMGYRVYLHYITLQYSTAQYSTFRPEPRYSIPPHPLPSSPPPFRLPAAKTDNPTTLSPHCMLRSRTAKKRGTLSNNCLIFAGPTRNRTCTCICNIYSILSRFKKTSIYINPAKCPTLNQNLRLLSRDSRWRICLIKVSFHSAHCHFIISVFVRYTVDLYSFD